MKHVALRRLAHAVSALVVLGVSFGAPSMAHAADSDLTTEVNAQIPLTMVSPAAGGTGWTMVTSTCTIPGFSVGWAGEPARNPYITSFGITERLEVDLHPGWYGSPSVTIEVGLIGPWTGTAIEWISVYCHGTHRDYDNWARASGLPPKFSDVTPPVITFSGNTGTYTLDQTISITCSASDPPNSNGAPVAGVAALVCPPVSAPADAVTPGLHALNGRARDNAGNIGTGSTTFNVRVTPAGYKSLVQRLLGASRPVEVALIDADLATAAWHSDMRIAAINDIRRILDTLALTSLDPSVSNIARHLRAETDGLLRPTLSGQVINDTDTRSLVYRGTGWGYFPGRPDAFFETNNDVHATTNDGDSVTATFTGSAVSFGSEVSVDYGQVEIWIDNQKQATVDASEAGVANLGGQILYTAAGLARGQQHTMTLIKRTGAYMVLDSLVVQP